MKRKEASFLGCKEWKEKTKTMGWRFRWLAVVVALVGMLAGLFLAVFLKDALGDDANESAEVLCLAIVAVMFCASFVSARCIVAFGGLIDDVRIIKESLLGANGDANADGHEGCFVETTTDDAS